MNNLLDDFLYHRLPAGVVTEDQRKLIYALLGGVQDRVAELKTLTNQLRDLWLPDNSVGEPYPVLLVSYEDPEIGSRTSILNFLDSTPDLAAEIELRNWAAAQLGIDAQLITNIVESTDANRTADSRTLQLLAETLGAVLYPPMSTDSAKIIANQKRTLRTYMGRLKTKGTPLSFALLGRLHDLDDVKITPLWGRFSPRQPGELSSSVNSADFSHIPQGQPTPGVKSNFYDPQVLNDGDAYEWVSGSVSIDAGQSDFILTSVNGANPFLEAKLLTTTPTLPTPGVYFLQNGNTGAAATTGNIPSATGLSGLELTALTAGESFNGAQITIEAVDSTHVSLKVRHALSSIKFRTSYFDVAATAAAPIYGGLYSALAQTSDDLSQNPALCQPLHNLGIVPYANNGVASDPYRFWTGGSRPLPVVTVWPTYSSVPGAGSSTERRGAEVDLAVLDLTPLELAGRRFTNSLNDVRPATRWPRSIGTGIGLFSQYQYAAVVSEHQLPLQVTAAPVSLGLEEEDVPSKPFTASMKFTGRLVCLNGPDVESNVQLDLVVGLEADPLDATQADFNLSHSTLQDPTNPESSPVSVLTITGSLDLDALTYEITTVSIGGTANPRTWLVLEAALYAYWQPDTTDRLQAEPAPQDDIDTTLFTVEP